MIDGCPECVTNTELPIGSAQAGDSTRAHYRCSDCGHEWFTTWRND